MPQAPVRQALRSRDAKPSDPLLAGCLGSGVRGVPKRRSYDPAYTGLFGTHPYGHRETPRRSAKPKSCRPPHCCVPPRQTCSEETNDRHD